MNKTTIKVEESRRQIITTSGHRETFHNITEVDLGGNWNRFQCAEGYVLVNPANVLCIVIDGEKIR